MSALALWLLLQLPATSLPSTAGERSLAAQAGTWTVVYFWSFNCPVVRSHDARFAQLVKTFGPRGVQFLMVDSQADASLDVARTYVAKRGYEVPIVVDVDSSWADALGVRFSATVVVLDPTGKVRYRGGVDSDRVKLGDDATPFAAQAIAALLDGHEPPQAETKALGCVLRRR